MKNLPTDRRMTKTTTVSQLSMSLTQMTQTLRDSAQQYHMAKISSLAETNKTCLSLALRSQMAIKTPKFSQEGSELTHHTNISFHTYQSHLLLCTADRLGIWLAFSVLPATFISGRA